MWRLFRKWRYFRWFYKEQLRQEKTHGLSGFGQAILISSQSAIDEYKKRIWVPFRKAPLALGQKVKIPLCPRMSEITIRRLLEQCISDGYIIQQNHGGPNLKTHPSKGENFKPWFSGLFLTEVESLNNIQQFFTGGVLVVILWVLHATLHFL